MARNSGRSLLVLFGLTLLGFKACFVSSPAEVQAPRGAAASALATAVITGTALPAFAERIPGGKFTKAQGKIVATPDEDGFTDSEVALALIVAAVVLYLAIEVTKSLFYGETYEKERPMTPFEKRIVETGVMGVRGDSYSPFRP
mmetsp:Transcript_64686/g.120408  ORF Transcript_64686/g.120408 Transcript_64686/m.120408 type:complete len:144 (+) Transcript_64686:68-499(+)